MKQPGTASLTERQIPQLIKDYQIGMYELVGQSSLPAVELFLFQCVHQFNGREEPYPPVMMNDGLDADGSGDMRLAGTGPANEHDVLGLIEELAAVQGFCQRHVHGTLQPAGQRLGKRVKLADTLPHRVLRLRLTAGRVLPDRGTG